IDTPQATNETGENTPVESRETAFPVAGTTNDSLPPSRWKFLRYLSPFWHDRLIEAGLILSLGLYYVVGNPNLGAGSIGQIPPYLYSFPFLAVFAILSWYRLAFAVALMPLALPYYLIQKTVFSVGARHLDFSLAEISLAVCALVALGQWLFSRGKWRYALSWRDLKDRLGPFTPPMALFIVAAAISVLIALERSTALRSFREEIFDPLLYLLLALCCLRTRQDLYRLLGAFLGSAMIIAAIGLIQYFFFADQLQQTLNEEGRVLAVYGSANSIGLFFDYVLPIGFSLLVFQFRRAMSGQGKWWLCTLMLIGFVPLISVVVLSQSLGTALALPIALLFMLAFSLRNRKILLIGGGTLLALVLISGIALREPLVSFISHWHGNSRGLGTFVKRYYLWQVAINMIGAFPWFGVGMDNWLCYYTSNNICPASHNVKHFVIYIIPGTHLGTGLGQEQTLSHPHDIFLHVWVSIGIFGLLAFLAVLALFYWLFVRIVKTLRTSTRSEVTSLEWVVLGIGGAMTAALFQGLIDSSFLEQDLAFCFWMLIVALLILRVLTGTSWRRRSL
ncbi:MAG TPA: O-antigen ligase family protein, partial [Ktedonobacteraceae bacterium]|nr:O-antigen ligase family protein [Ktedonobacteraceae bacterium]